MITAYPPREGRVHEVFGPMATLFALRLAEQGGGALWVHERRGGAQLNPLGFDGLDPARLVLAVTERQLDTLAVAEEALRDGAPGLVVMETSAPLSLTAGRRLQLAAQAGGSTGLVLIPEGMGSPAAETRWYCAAAFDPSDSTLQFWELIKSKSGTTGSRYVRWDAQARRVVVVSPARNGPGSPRAPG